MAFATSLIPGLDEIVRGDDPKRRADAARRIAELFFQGAGGGFKPEHVEFFDSILIGLVPRTELIVRADIAERLSCVVNAPRNLVGQLAREDEIVIAGRLLRGRPVTMKRPRSRMPTKKTKRHRRPRPSRRTPTPARPVA